MIKLNNCAKPNVYLMNHSVMVDQNRIGAEFMFFFYILNATIKEISETLF